MSEMIEIVLLIIIIWLCLTRTGNYQIHEMDIDRGLDFPIQTEKVAN